MNGSHTPTTVTNQDLLELAEQTISDLQDMLLTVSLQPDVDRASEHAYFGIAIAERYWQKSGRQKPEGESDDESEDELEDDAEV